MKNKILSNVGDMINEAVNSSKNLKEGVLKAQWVKILGKVGNDSQPEYIKDGVLTITVESPLFIHYFTGKKGELIEKINEHFKEELIHDVEIRSGKLDEKRAEYLEKDISYDEDYEEEPKSEEYDEEEYTKDDDFEEDYEREFDQEVYKEEDFVREFEAEKEAQEKEEEIKSKIEPEATDLSPEGIFKKIKYLEELSRKREEYLLAKGYKKCRGCGVVFDPTEDEDYCKVCTTVKKNRKKQNV